MNWDSLDQQALDVPGGRRGVDGPAASRFAARLRREAQGRGLELYTHGRQHILLVRILRPFEVASRQRAREVAAQKKARGF